ncbi:protein kinase [Streptomyces albiflavescens]|uniref:Protein kinase n=1 Tax=Streptomyces albiflavescens TaxID=1623582 RepID=A0A917XXC9_9ACTN|nr:SAV_2336 N-terminal domain-related protein [Streptomyces albiflavescens]GGN56404.1 protein kinase [Streptomyces albiflavescens]
MRSESTGARLLSRLSEILAEAGDGMPPTPVELAELLWLAPHMDGAYPVPGSAATPAPSPSDAREPRTPSEPTPSEPPTEKPPLPAAGPEVPVPTRNNSRVPLHLPAPSGRTKPHASLLAPAPPMLRRPLALQRALRPLKRHTDAPVGHELDERATAHRIARLGGHPEWWLPVMRPARERWLRLNLVYDTGPTMPVWRPLIRELHTALAQSGVFRTMTVHRARPDGSITGAGAHVPADGRTVTLLVSDCMGPQWWAGPTGDRWHTTLHRLAHRMPLAIVQPLPERLWRDTALPTEPGLLSAPFPAAPLSSLAFTPYDTSEGQLPTGAVPLPVLEPDAPWLAHWSTLVASRGSSQLPGSVAHLTPRPGQLDASGNRSDITRLPAEELVLRFRATASPEAFRLAGHLAVGRPDLPVMRLVHAAVEPRPRPQHLAEVILSGMLTSVPGPPGSYAFRPGVRDLLLRSLPRTARGRTTRLLARMGALIDERAGMTAGEFRASTPVASGPGAVAEDEPIATVSPESVRRLLGKAAPERPPTLGDRYRTVERLGPSGTLWRAEDTDLGRSVVVRLYPPQTDVQAFVRDARALAGVDHPNVVAVLDYGVEGEVPFVVMEHLDGIALNSLASAGGYRLPVPLLVSLGQQLAAALTTLHSTGVTHGALDMTRVLILPDGTAKLTLFDLGRREQRDRFGADLVALGRLVFHLSSGGPAHAGTSVAPERLACLPTELRPLYASALRLLLSEGSITPRQRRQGMARLRSSDLSRLAESAYSPLRYSLLGPPEVHRGTGHPLAVGSPQEQAMLCMLLLQHGRKVTQAKLTEGIWGRKPPQRSQALIGTYASRLRNALGPGVLATLSDGYALHTSADFVDVVDCQRSVARAEAERATGNTEFALAHVNNALDLWRGTALDSVPGPAADTTRTRLLQLRLSLCATRAELRLDLGEFEGAAVELAALVRAHPSREDFRRLHIVALQRQGRTEDALEAFEEYGDFGGQSPELLILGRELREELGEPPEEETESTYEQTTPDATPYDGLVAAPDELPEGPFPTEDQFSTPLLSPQEESTEDTDFPDDDAAERPFAVEDELAEAPADAYDEPPEPPYDSYDSYDPYEEPPHDLDDAYDDPPEDLWERPALSYRTSVFFDLAEGGRDLNKLAALGRLVARLLTASGLAENEYRILSREEGYTVLLNPYVSALPLLLVTLNQLPSRLDELDDARLTVAFRRLTTDEGAEGPDPQSVEDILASSDARAVVAVSPSVHAEVDERPSFVDPDLLAPLATDDGWYRLIHTPPPSRRRSTLPPAGKPVQGPFPVPAGGWVPLPEGEKAVVYLLRDNGLALPDSPTVRLAPPSTRATWRYYEVDLAERLLAVPSAPEVEVAWCVSDPVEASRSPDLDMPRVLTDVVGAALRDGLDTLAGNLSRWHVSGYALRWRVRDSTAQPPPWRTAGSTAQPSRTRPSPTDLLSTAEGVILGFEGTLARLYRPGDAAEVMHDLARLIVEGRDPDDALSGHPLTPQEGPVAPLEGYANPLDLLRAFAGHALADELRRRLDHHEVRAARTAQPTALADHLVRALHSRGVPVAVVTDHATPAAETYLQRRELTGFLSGGIHGRGTDPARMMPHPYTLHRALDRFGAPASRCLLVGSTAAEQSAAGAIGLPFIGFARDEQVRRRLRTRDGGQLLISGLRPLLRAAQSR